MVISIMVSRKPRRRNNVWADELADDGQILLTRFGQHHDQVLLMNRDNTSIFAMPPRALIIHRSEGPPTPM